MTYPLAIVGRVGVGIVGGWIEHFDSTDEAAEWISDTLMVSVPQDVETGNFYIDWPCSLPEQADRTDVWGRRIVAAPEELCPFCRQPDNCGDCEHGKIPDNILDTLR